MAILIYIPKNPAFKFLLWNSDGNTGFSSNVTTILSLGRRNFLNWKPVTPIGTKKKSYNGLSQNPTMTRLNGFCGKAYSALSGGATEAWREKEREPYFKTGSPTTTTTTDEESSCWEPTPFIHIDSQQLVALPRNMLRAIPMASTMAAFRARFALGSHSADVKAFVLPPTTLWWGHNTCAESLGMAEPSKICRSCLHNLRISRPSVGLFLAPTEFSYPFRDGANVDLSGTKLASTVHRVPKGALLELCKCKSLNVFFKIYSWTSWCWINLNRTYLASHGQWKQIHTGCFFNCPHPPLNLLSVGW